MSEPEPVANLNEASVEPQTTEQAEPQGSEPESDAIDAILGRLGQTPSDETDTAHESSLETPALQQPEAEQATESAEDILNRLIPTFEPTTETEGSSTNEARAVVPDNEQVAEPAEAQTTGESVEDILSRLNQTPQPEAPTAPFQEEQTDEPNSTSPTTDAQEQPEGQPANELSLIHISEPTRPY